MKPLIPLLVAWTLCAMHGFAQIQTANSYLDVSKPTGGPISTGDTLEIRGIISVPNGTSITSLQYNSTVPGSTSYIAGTLEAETNEGVILGTIPNTGTYTDIAGDDRGQILLNSAVTINMGTGATSAAGGSVTGGTTTPVFYNSQSILMAAYRVKVTGSSGATFAITGQFTYKLAGVTTTSSSANLQVSIYNLVTCQSTGPTNYMTDETSGTFGSGNTLNRSSSTDVTGFTYIAIGANNPPDGDYSIVNNTSPTQYTGATPAGSDKVFGDWDIIGDHTGAASTSAGNPPTAKTATGGYLLAVNGSYAPSSVFITNITGLVANTEYIMSFWMYNLCPDCGGNPASNAASGTPGVKPNLAFAISNFDFYNTGEIAYSGKWVQNSFTFNSGANTSLKINIRNNAPGGGGNDYAIDDITMTTCLTILPLKLESFTGRQEPGGVALNWQTESEENVSYFVIERSMAGANFDSIGRVDAVAQASGGVYHFTDSSTLAPGQVFYRLRIIDKDGNPTYGPLVAVDGEDNLPASMVSVAPNPAKGTATLYMVATAPGTVQVSLWSLSGVRLLSQNNTVSAGQNALPLNAIDHLPKGIYIVRMLSGSRSAYTKLLIE